MVAGIKARGLLRAERWRRMGGFTVQEGRRMRGFTVAERARAQLQDDLNLSNYEFG